LRNVKERPGGRAQDCAMSEARHRTENQDTDATLAQALDRYAATSGHRLVEEILAEHEADLFRPAPSVARRSGKRADPRLPRLYWLDRD